MQAAAMEHRERMTGARWLYLAVGAVMLLFLGLIYAWSVFISPLEQEFGWNRAQTSMTFTLSIIFFCLGGIAGGALNRRFPARRILALAAGLVCLGFGLASLVQTLGGIYVSYGLFVGFGVGIAYNTLISVVSKHFPDRKGLCSGVLLMGFGGGGMLLGSVATGLMATMGWRPMFRVFALVFAAVLLGGAWLIQPAKAQSASVPGAGVLVPEGARPVEMIKTRTFWMYFVWSMMLVASGLIIIGHAAAVATDFGAGQQAAALVAGCVALSNGLGRMVFGALFDRLGLGRTMALITLCALLAPASLLLAARTGALELVILGFVLSGAFYGGVPTMNATFAASRYGPAHFPVNFSMVNSTLLFAPLIGSYLAGTLRQHSGSYLTSFVVMLVFAAVSVPAGLEARKRERA